MIFVLSFILNEFEKWWSDLKSVIFRLLSKNYSDAVIDVLIFVITAIIKAWRKKQIIDQFF
jgi:hypothetical protein